MVHQEVRLSLNTIHQNVYQEVIECSGSLSSQAVAKMVQECYKYVDAVSDLTVKLRLIDTLRTVTAGKVGSPAAP